MGQNSKNQLSHGKRIVAKPTTMHVLAERLLRSPDLICKARYVLRMRIQEDNFITPPEVLLAQVALDGVW